MAPDQDQGKYSNHFIKFAMPQNDKHLLLLYNSSSTHFTAELIVSESRGYLGFSTVMLPPQRFPFGRDNFKNILVRTFKFGMWVYMGNATNAIVL